MATKAFAIIAGAGPGTVISLSPPEDLANEPQGRFYRSPFCEIIPRRPPSPEPSELRSHRNRDQGVRRPSFWNQHRPIRLEQRQVRLQQDHPAVFAVSACSSSV